MYDKHRVEDVDTDGEDHRYDRDRYLFMSRPPISTPVPEEVKTVLQADYQRYINNTDDEETYEEEYF